MVLHLDDLCSVGTTVETACQFISEYQLGKCQLVLICIKLSPFQEITKIESLVKPVVHTQQ